MKVTRSSVGRVVISMLECPNLKRATMYLDDHTTAKCTRLRRPDKRLKPGETFVLTVGTPNYAERQFIADCSKAGVCLPLRKLQLKWFKKGSQGRNEQHTRLDT